MKIPYTQISKEKTQFHNLSDCEWRAYLYLTSCQEEETGCVEGLYYKDVMKETGMCKQSFYNALKGLSEKGIITSEKNSEVDYDICITGNAIPWKGNAGATYKDGYISLSNSLFYSEGFRKLKAHEIYLALYFLKCTHCANEHSFHQRKKDFLSDWSRLFDVTERVVRGYLHSLKTFFTIGVKNSQYYVTPLKWILQKEGLHDKDWRSELSHMYDQFTRAQLHRNRVAYTKEELRDTSDLFKQYREISGGLAQIRDAVKKSIEKSVEGLKWKERKLSAPWIHKLLRKVLGLPEADLPEFTLPEQTYAKTDARVDRQEEAAHADHPLKSSQELDAELHALFPPSGNVNPVFAN